MQPFCPKTTDETDEQNHDDDEVEEGEDKGGEAEDQDGQEEEQLLADEYVQQDDDIDGQDSTKTYTPYEFKTKHGLQSDWAQP